MQSKKLENAWTNPLHLKTTNPKEILNAFKVLLKHNVKLKEKSEQASATLLTPSWGEIVQTAQSHLCSVSALPDVKSAMKKLTNLGYKDKDVKKFLFMRGRLKGLIKYWEQEVISLRIANYPMDKIQDWDGNYN